MGVDMVNKRLGAFYPNLFVIDETFVLSKYISDYKIIVLMTIRYKQLDSASYGNESILEVVSVHYHK